MVIAVNEAEQFEMIVSDYYEGLFRFAVSLTREEADARDLTQHTFYVWAKKGHTLRDFSKVKTWLFTTLHRAFLVRRRRDKRFVHQELETVLDELPTVSAELAPHTDHAQVLDALGALDNVYQGAVALFYLEDCSYQEIAEILQVPIGTVKSRIARGIRQLREVFLRDGDTERDTSPSLAQEPVRIS